MPTDSLNPETDPFHPPAIPTEVGCLHCQREYDSYLIEWRIETGADGMRHGFWCCPTPGCGGRGFGCDILPTDPDYVGEDGEAMWCWDDDDDDDDLEFAGDDSDVFEFLDELDDDEEVPF